MSDESIVESLRRIQREIEAEREADTKAAEDTMVSVARASTYANWWAKLTEDQLREEFAEERLSWEYERKALRRGYRSTIFWCYFVLAGLIFAVLARDYGWFN